MSVGKALTLLSLLMGLSGCLNESLVKSYFEAAAARHQAGPSWLEQQQQTRQEKDRKVYDADECIGPVIMGRCHGTILPNKSYHPTCYGEWIGGRCTGPQF